ncbi:hypothetical protein GCM10020220_093490 [Nonomuraea rubra]
MDLVQEFALPIPSLVICELLGVPYGERAQFQADTKVLASLESKADDAIAALGSISAYLYGLVQRKRKEPGDDLLSGLIESGELSDEDLTGVGVLLLHRGARRDDRQHAGAGDVRAAHEPRPARRHARRPLRGGQRRRGTAAPPHDHPSRADALRAGGRGDRGRHDQGR